MHISTITRGFFTALLLGGLAAAIPARAQSSTSSHIGLEQGQTPPFQLGLQYQATRANAGPQDCGCFWMEGGGVQLNFALSRRFSAVADLSGGGVANINGTNERLSFFNYVFGPRYSLRTHSRYTPYVQALAGGDQTFSNYLPYASGSASLAVQAGGGLDVRVSRYLSIVPVDGEWVYSRQLNGLNTHQNNVRIGGGVVFRLQR